MFTKSQRITIRIGILISIVILIYGAILIVDEYQKEKRRETLTESVDLERYDTVYPSFNVEGLTDEEIEYMLELYRQQNSGGIK